MASSSSKDGDLSSNPEGVVHRRSDAEVNVRGLSSFDRTVKQHSEKPVESETGSEPLSRDYTHRKLKPRHIQLIGIGGTIGTALYIQIGKGLMQGGPASLFIAFTLWYVCFFVSRSQ